MPATASLAPPPTLTVAVVDDEPLAREGLALILGAMPEVRIVAVAANADAALAAFAEHRPDMALLDIQMPKRSGMDLARSMTASHAPDIVFVTAHQGYAPQAFEVDAVDFVLKPVNADRLREAVSRAIRRKALRSLEAEAAAHETIPAASPGYLQDFWVPRRNGVTRVPVASVEWIEAARDYVLLHTSLATYMYRTTMAKLQGELDPSLMLRVHRSSFVNALSIEEIIQVSRGIYSLRLRGEAKVRIGRMYASATLDRLRG